MTTWIGRTTSGAAARLSIGRERQPRLTPNVRSATPARNSGRIPIWPQAIVYRKRLLLIPPTPNRPTTDVPSTTDVTLARPSHGTRGPGTFGLGTRTIGWSQNPTPALRPSSSSRPSSRSSRSTASFNDRSPLGRGSLVRHADRKTRSRQLGGSLPHRFAPADNPADSAEFGQSRRMPHARHSLRSVRLRPIELGWRRAAPSACCEVQSPARSAR